METVVALVATAAALLLPTLIARIVRHRRAVQLKVLSQRDLEAIRLDMASLPREPGTRDASVVQPVSVPVRTFLAIRVGLSIVVLVPALGVLVFGGADHSWKDGAQYALGMVMGYWFNEGAKGR